PVVEQVQAEPVVPAPSPKPIEPVVKPVQSPKPQVAPAAVTVSPSRPAPKPVHTVKATPEVRKLVEAAPVVAIPAVAPAVAVVPPAAAPSKETEVKDVTNEVTERVAVVGARQRHSEVKAEPKTSIKPAPAVQAEVTTVAAAPSSNATPPA